MYIEVSIIIINYNTFDLTSKCIQSIYDKTAGIHFEIILVDNASTECDPEIFATQFPEIILIKNTQNVGFARGNNIGIQYAKGAYILLLNSDAELIENSIKFIYEKCLPINDLGAATVKLIYPNGQVQAAANYLPNTWLQFLEVSRLFRLFKKYYTQRRPKLDYNKNFIADWIWGTFFFFPKKNIDASGGRLSETFFMYSEDVEWCYLFSKKNLKNYYFGDSAIIHHFGKSAFKGKNKALTNNYRRFIQKYYGNFNYVSFVILDSISNFIEEAKKRIHI